MVRGIERQKDKIGWRCNKSMGEMVDRCEAESVGWLRSVLKAGGRFVKRRWLLGVG